MTGHFCVIMTAVVGYGHLGDRGCQHTVAPEPSYLRYNGLFTLISKGGKEYKKDEEKQSKKKTDKTKQMERKYTLVVLFKR